MDCIFKGMFVRETPQSNHCTGKTVDRDELSPATCSGALPASLPSAGYSTTTLPAFTLTQLLFMCSYMAVLQAPSTCPVLLLTAVSPTPTLVSPAGI